VAISRFLGFANAAPAKAEVLVRVTNRYNPAVPPLTADFTFYGGLYRDAYLVAAEAVHFDLANYASAGAFTTTPSVSAEAATVVVTGALANESPTPQPVTVLTNFLGARLARGERDNVSKARR
jgi:beta-galactosidase